MPLRVEGISRKRLCLLVLQARKKHSGRQPAQAPPDPTSASRSSAASTGRVGCGNALERSSAAQRQRVQRKTKSSYLRRMYRVHSLRNIARLMRGYCLEGEDDFDWEIMGSDLESSEDVMLPCGLREHEAVSMMHRELTPEDYEKLCKLDEAVPKRNTVDEGEVDNLPRLRGREKSSGECGVCLSDLSSGEVAKLPCSHRFHIPCIKKWLTQCKNTCPICSVPLSQAYSEAA